MKSSRVFSPSHAHCALTLLHVMGSLAPAIAGRRGPMRTRGENSAKRLSACDGRHICARQGTRRLPIAFSTLGCPAWASAKILNFAGEHGFRCHRIARIARQPRLALSPGSLRRNASLRRSAIFSLAVFGSPASAVPPALHESDPEKRSKIWRTPGDSSTWLLSLDAPYRARVR